MNRLEERGARLHETCRWGSLTPAFIIPADGGEEKPTVIPLCSFPLPDPLPPGVRRAWGGAIKCHEEVKP